VSAAASIFQRPSSNGRLSEQSFRRYGLVRSFVSQVVNCLDLAIMQTEADAHRIRNLGLEPNRVFVSGNVKFDAGTTDDHDSLNAELTSRFALCRRGGYSRGEHARTRRAHHHRGFSKLLNQHRSAPRLIIAPGILSASRDCYPAERFRSALGASHRASCH